MHWDLSELRIVEFSYETATTILIDIYWPKRKFLNHKMEQS